MQSFIDSRFTLFIKIYFFVDSFPFFVDLSKFCTRKASTRNKGYEWMNEWMNEYSKSLTLQVFLRTSLLQAWATMRHLPLLGRINTTGHYFLISTLNNGDEAARKATKQLSLTSMWWKLAFIFIMSFKSSQYCIV